MRGWGAATAVELGLVVLGLVGAVLSWRHGIQTTTFAAAGPTPEFVATRYVAPWLVLAAALVALAGVFAINAVSRVVRHSRDN
ncbi:hypothetical protein [Nocardia altamirensis]|uniref:hypothetical protein n=1 Tax=Nocardia altamirensis TaxID=472158 RepID=UPI0008408409|nr:hypothetical protein [Nocardia altamirensis]